MKLKSIAVVMLFIFLLLNFSACLKQKKPIYQETDLHGAWMRTSSSRAMYDSMLVEINASTAGAIILRTSPLGYFTVGSRKWKNITPNDDSTFVYEELGSNNTYYGAKMTYIKNASNGIETLFLEVNSNGEENGSWQYWERQ